MPGVTKHIYDHEIRDIVSMWNIQIKTIQYVLPQKYTNEEILMSVRQFYPHEWNSVQFKYDYYLAKDRYLKKGFGKARYNMKKPEELFVTVSIYKKIVDETYRKKYADNYSEERAQATFGDLLKRRKNKIDKIDQKIDKALIKTQQVTPSFIDQLIGLYERKTTDQKDKMYILLELKKYYCPKIIQFMFKLNDTELNKQLRMESFYHLQSFNYQPRLRRQKYMQIHTKNKKRKDFLKNIYPNQKYSIPKNPGELEYRIDNSKEQKIKYYDYFISHSSIDSSSVQKLIKFVNTQGKNIFCDWINDVDYLKRHLACDATLKVIEKRMDQSRTLVFVVSENSKQSIWCKYELNYFMNLNKPMYFIAKSDIDNEVFNFKELTDKWFVDSNYKELALLESTKLKITT
ncbi:TIR domain-containing protein [Cellulosilyticum sp. I15G10I2]|uniref:TIR domain-containing protein n=1 Tax=Cellulosilyticum sp. I15G10I2 TaxID=1892843 RepID=UPI00085C48FA|nr:TIR domain-containing protein [Cellulosilyticum sp. I15G10I2]